MTKLKINPGLACGLLVGSFLVGGSSLFLVTLLLFIFCEVTDSTKDTAVRVITFFIGITIVSLGWSLIVDGIDVLVDFIKWVISSLNSFRDYDNQIDANKWINIITGLVSVVNSLIILLIALSKLVFAVSVITGKKGSENFVSKKINEYVNKALVYVNNIGTTNNTQQQ